VHFHRACKMIPRVWNNVVFADLPRTAVPGRHMLAVMVGRYQEASQTSLFDLLYYLLYHRSYGPDRYRLCYSAGALQI